MAVTLIYEPQEGPHGARREAAVYETVEEALFQAAWDEMVGPNRFPEKIVKGAHHGSDGWKPRSRRRGRPVWVDDGETQNAHEVHKLADVIGGDELIAKAVAVVRRHYVVHADDAADPKIPAAFGSPMVPVEPNDAADAPSPSVADCLRELKALVA